MVQVVSGMVAGVVLSIVSLQALDRATLPPVPSPQRVERIKPPRKPATPRPVPLGGAAILSPSDWLSFCK